MRTAVDRQNPNEDEAPATGHVSPLIDATIGVLHSPAFPDVMGDIDLFIEAMGKVHAKLFELRERESMS